MNPNVSQQQARNPRTTTQTSGRESNGTAHQHRTAKIVELVGCSSKGFEDAVRNCLQDASATTRGISGCSVEHMSVKCENGKIIEYRVNVKVSFGIERTPPTDNE